MEYSKLKNNIPKSKSSIINYTKQLPILTFFNKSEISTLSKNENSNKKNITINSNNISDISKKIFNGTITNKSRNLESNIDLSILSTSKSIHRSKSELLYTLNNKNIMNNKNKVLNKKNIMPIISEREENKKKNSNIKILNDYKNKKFNLKISESEIIGNNFNNNNKNKINKINKKEYYSFQPKISKNSIRIAEKLENSFIRINKIPIKKLSEKSQTKIFEFELIQKKYNNLKNKKSISKSKNYINPNESLYQNGLFKIKEKEIERKKILEERENLYKTFSYTPKILKRKINFNFGIDYKFDNDKSPFDNFYLRNILWKERIRNKSVILLKKNQLKELEECSFSPKIIKKRINNDTSFILKNIEQIDKYVRNRQEFLNKKKLIEIENEKKFFNINYLKAHHSITNINKLRNKKTIIIKDYYTQDDGKYC